MSRFKRSVYVVPVVVGACALMVTGAVAMVGALGQPGAATTTGSPSVTGAGPTSNSGPGAGSSSAAGAGPTSGPAARDSTAGYVTTSDPVTSYQETSNVAIPSWDGTILEADEYIPTTCTATARCPVVLIQTPYRKGQSSSSPSDLGSPSSEAIPYLYDHGYIEVVVDVRGTGSSEGYWDSFGLDEQKDGAFLVDWVANTANIPASDGKVALAGVSYSGINQLLTAEQYALLHPGLSRAHSPLKAIFPIVSMADAYRDVTWAGGNIDSGFIPLWLGLVNVLGVMPPDTLQSDPPVALNAESQHLEDLAMFAAPAIGDASLGAYESALPPDVTGAFSEQAYDSPFYTERSPVTNIAEVAVPTFLVGGTYDLFQRGEPLLYNALDLPANEKKVMIGPWYHVTEGTGLTNDDGSSPVADNTGTVLPSIDNLELAWFDHWLKGTGNGVQSFPTVETYRLGAGQWYQDTTYPAAGTVGQRWYLSATGTTTGTLGTAAPSGTSKASLPGVGAAGICSRSTWQWTAGIPTELKEPFPLCEDDSTLTQSQGLTFTSPAFSSPYTMSGPIEADLYMSATSADSTVVATLSDVSSSGASDITAGTLVASMRQVTSTPCGHVVNGCTVYLPAYGSGDPESVEPWHPYLQSTQTPLQPGTIYELQIEIFPTSATIEPGDQLRVTITTSDVPHESQTLSTTANSLGIDTFYFGGQNPSSIYLGTISPLQP